MRRWGKAAAQLAAVGMLGSWAVGCKPPQEGDDAQEADAGELEAAIPVELSEVTRGAITQTLESTATVAARREVVVLAESRGTATEVKVEEGDRVEQGQLLARLSNPELEMTVPTAASNVSRLRREVGTLEPLMQKGFVSRQSYEEMRFQLTQAQDQLRRAQTQVAALRVKAPLTGLVARRSAVQGQLVNPGQELFYIVDPTELEVVVNIPEKALGRVAEGGDAWVESEALGETRFTGKIRLINPVVNPQTGTVKVTVALSEAGEGLRRLRPGMFVSAHLVTDARADAALIPKRALIYKDDAPFVVVARPEGDKLTAQQVRVELGFGEGQSVEVRQGLEVGDRVVVLGQAGLKDGAELKVVE